MPEREKFTFTVHGRGRFPEDMLRYDSCDFRDEAQKEIAYGPQGEPGDIITGPHRFVMLETDGDFITTGRWLSFGWQVQGTTHLSPDMQRGRIHRQDFDLEAKDWQPEPKRVSVERHLTDNLLIVIRYDRPVTAEDARKLEASLDNYERL